MKTKKKKILFVTTCALVIISTPLLWRMCILMGLPNNDSYIPGLAATEIIEIPQRPGIQGIVITGPIIEPLFFTIDLRRSPNILDWENLNNIEPGADVKIRAKIREGKMEFDRAKGDIKDTGYPTAGSIIETALKSWCYKPYKEGEIRFWFHLGSEREKLIINPSGLKPKEKFAKYPIHDGKLHNIKGIKKTEIRIEKFRF